MNKFMRIVVLFDLPVQTKKQRHDAAAFRNFLLKDGYYMLQYSIYVRICNGIDAVQKHKARLREHLPDNGAVRLLTITEKQYEAIEVLLGNFVPEDSPFACDQTTVI